ncbi:hypothetical protein ACR9E3_22555 [Actinomycetospora sp. C-140]
MDQFDPNRPGEIEGEITALLVIDPVAPQPPHQGNRVVDPTKPFEVTVAWTLSGTDVPLWLSGRTSNWVVSAYAESIGAGFEGLLGTNESVAADPNQRDYTATITVPANKLQEADPGTEVSGLYKLAVTVFLDSTLPAPGFDMIGFREGPIIQVEDMN